VCMYVCVCVCVYMCVYACIRFFLYLLTITFDIIIHIKCVGGDCV